MNILALDLATKCGWAFAKVGYHPTCGTVDFANRKFDGAGVRFLKFEKWLTTRIKDLDLDLVVFEGVRAHLANAVDAAHLYGGWLAVLQSTCEKHDVPYTALGVTEIKKFWTGKGNATKTDMIDRCRDKGFNPKDDNAADALAIWHMAEDQFGL